MARPSDIPKIAVAIRTFGNNKSFEGVRVRAGTRFAVGEKQGDMPLLRPERYKQLRDAGLMRPWDPATEAASPPKKDGTTAGVPMYEEQGKAIRTAVAAKGKPPTPKRPTARARARGRTQADPPDPKVTKSVTVSTPPIGSPDGPKPPAPVPASSSEGGPSVKLVQLSEARGTPGLKWAVVNNAYRLVPWADVLYACDKSWWRVHQGAKGFGGLKITQDRTAIIDHPDLKRVQCRKGVDALIFERYAEVGWAGNGGFHLLNLVIQFGVRNIILVGYDMSIDHGYHWHGRHEPGLNNPKQAGVDRWRMVLDSQKPALDRMGIRVVLGSPNSRLTAFPRMDFMEAVRAACQNPHE